MNTPSHLVITAAIRRRFLPADLPTKALLWGSVAPDLPLFALSIGGFLYYVLLVGMDLSGAAELMYSELFYTDPIWIWSHNLLHSPLSLFLLGLIVWFARRQPKALQSEQITMWMRRSWYFLISCAFHSVIDIFTHVDDGPLLLLPFNQQLRYESPISYWDPAFYGRQFMIFELTLVLLLSVWLLLPALRRVGCKMRERFRRCDDCAL